MQATPSPVLGPMPLAAGPLPTTASGKGLLVPGPAAAAASPGLNFGGLPQQVLQQYAAANMAVMQDTNSSQAAAAGAGIPGNTAGVLPPVPELSLGMGPPASAMPAQGPVLQEQFSNPGLRSPAWMQNPAAAQSSAQQVQQQSQAVAAQQQQASGTSTRPPAVAAGAQGAAQPPGSNATPKTPAIPSAFAALAAQPISANDSPQEPHESTPTAQTASPSPAPAAAGTGAGAGAGISGAPAPRGPGNSGLTSSGLGSSLQHSRSSGVSWLPPLSGRKRSHAAASGATDSTSGRAPTSAAAPAGPGSQPQAAPASQLSADMERLLNAAGFNPSPSLSTFPSMGLFMDTVSPAAAAGGAGSSLLRPSTAPNRTASAGLSRLLSLDLASLLRGTSMFPTPGAIPGVQGAGAGGAVGGSAGALASLDVTFKVEDDGLPTPHAAAAAEAMMALGDPVLGSLPDLGAAAAGTSGAAAAAGAGGGAGAGGTGA